MAKNQLVAGIDIGTEKICTVIATINSETGETSVIGVAASPSLGLRKSQIVDLEESIKAVTQSVEAAERMAGLNISTAVVSISGAHISSQNSKGVVAVSAPETEITIDDVDRVIEAARAIALPSAREIIHVIPKSFTVDSQGGIKDPVGMTGVRLEAEAHIITGAATAIKNVSKCVTELGIAPKSLVFSALSSAYACLSETEKELGVVLVDIGGGTTSICAYVDGSLTYTGVLPIGAKNITNDLAIGMRISLSAAEKIKLYLSQTHKEPPLPVGAKPSEVAKIRKDFDTIDLKILGIVDDDVTASRKSLVEGIIKPRVTEIFTLIHDTLKAEGILDKVPAGLVLCGGGAETVSMIDVSKRLLSLPARIGIPKSLKGLVDELNSPSYSTAAGLIHYATKHGAFSSGKSQMKGVGNILPKLPLQNAYQSLVNLIKSLLP